MDTEAGIDDNLPLKSPPNGEGVAEPDAVVIETKVDAETADDDKMETETKLEPNVENEAILITQKNEKNIADQSITKKCIDGDGVINTKQGDEKAENIPSAILPGNKKVTPEQREYFKKTMTILKTTIKSEESLTALAVEVFEKCEPNALEVFCETCGSDLVHHVIGYTNAETYEKFAVVVLENLPTIARHKFAYYMIVQLLQISFIRCTTNEKVDTTSLKDDDKIVINFLNYNINQNFSDEHKEFCKDFLETVGKYFVENVEEYVHTRSGNYMIRLCITTLSGKSGMRRNTETNGNKTAYNKSYFPKDCLTMNVREGWYEIIRKFGENVKALPQFVDFPYNPLTKDLIRSLLDSFNTVDTKLSNMYGTYLLNESFCKVTNEKTKSLRVFSTESSIKLFESFLRIADDKLMKKFYLKLIQPKITQLCVDEKTNFAIVIFLEVVRDKQIFINIFEKIAPSFEHLIQKTRTGIIVALADGCKRFAVKQKSFETLLRESLNCTETNEHRFFTCLLKLKKSETLYGSGDSNYIHLHGTYLISQMLKFERPIKLVQNLMSMENYDITNIFCISQGTKICDAFMKSEFIAPRVKDQLVQKMKGEYTKFSQSASGSHCIDSFYDAASAKHKEVIIKELSKYVAEIKSNPHGKNLVAKYKMDLYKLDKAKWKNDFLKNSSSENNRNKADI